MHISNYPWPLRRHFTRQQCSSFKRRATTGQKTQIVPRFGLASIGAVASIVSALSKQEIVALTEYLINLLDWVDGDPDLEDSFDQEWLDEREMEDGC